VHVICFVQKLFVHYKLFTGFSVDFPPCVLHAVYEGVAKQFLKYWCSPNSPKVSWTSEQRSAVSQFLVSVKPPSRISRPPRDLQKRAKFKGHELNVWLFYLSPVICETVLPPSYYYHWLELVRGLSLLLRNRVPSSAVEQAELCIANFLSDLPELYGNVSHFNVHLLSHLPFFAAQRGPLFLSSMTGFETYNLKLKNFITGPYHVLPQIGKRYLSELVVLCSNNTITTSNPQRGDGHENVVMNHYKKSEIPLGVYNFLSQNFPAESARPLLFKRCSRNGKVFQSLSYDRVSVRNSSCVLLGDGRFFEIEIFLKSVDTPSQIYAIGKEFRCSAFNDLDYIWKSNAPSLMTAVTLNQLGDIVMKLELNDNVYFCSFLNNYECVSE